VSQSISKKVKGRRLGRNCRAQNGCVKGKKERGSTATVISDSRHCLADVACRSLSHTFEMDLSGREASRALEGYWCRSEGERSND